MKMYAQNIASARSSSAVHRIAAESRSVFLTVSVISIGFRWLVGGQTTQYWAKLIKLFENRPFLTVFSAFWQESGLHPAAAIAENLLCGLVLVPMRQAFRQKRPFSWTHRLVYCSLRPIIRNCGRRTEGKGGAVPHRRGVWLTGQFFRNCGRLSFPEKS